MDGKIGKITQKSKRRDKDLQWLVKISQLTKDGRLKEEKYRWYAEQELIPNSEAARLLFG